MADLERVLVETEDYLIRQLGSRSAREASARKLQRGVGEAFRRVRRAGLIFVALVFGLILWSAIGGGIGFFAWLVALPTAFLAALLSMTFPTRQGRARHLPDEPLAPPPLPNLAEACEGWLIDRSPALPRYALAATDKIVARLRALAPHLAGLPEGDPLAGEARRLIGGHLPRLVDSYAALPPEARGPRSENSRRIADGLDIVADELARLCEKVEGCRAAAFETEHRFIEMRYRDEDGLLRGE